MSFPAVAVEPNKTKDSTERAPPTKPRAKHGCGGAAFIASPSAPGWHPWRRASGPPSPASRGLVDPANCSSTVVVTDGSLRQVGRTTAGTQEIWRARGEAAAAKRGEHTKSLGKVKSGCWDHEEPSGIEEPKPGKRSHLSGTEGAAQADASTTDRIGARGGVDQNREEVREHLASPWGEKIEATALTAQGPP